MGKAKRKRGLPRMLETQISTENLDLDYDIHVEAKPAQVVMLRANPVGCKVVEELWPAVKWSTDARFASDEWQFTLIRVTRLPPHIEATGIPLNEAVPDSLGIIVARQLQWLAAFRRVLHWVGQGEDAHVCKYDVTEMPSPLAVEYVPPGTGVGPSLASFVGPGH
jgi:hypothetical protein